MIFPFFGKDCRSRDEKKEKRRNVRAIRARNFKTGQENF